MTCTQNLEAEAFLLALICRDPAVLDELPALQPLDFSGKRNRAIFIAIQRLIRDQKPVDVPHVNGIVLRADPPVTEEDVRSVFALEVPPGTHDKYFKLVRDQRVLASIFRFGGNCSQSVVSFGVDDDVETLVDKVEKGALKIRDEVETGEQMSDAADVLKRIAADLNKPKEERSRRKIPTGWGEIDTFTGGGFFGGDMNLIVARPSDGKTASILQIAVNIHHEFRVGILSLEMPEEQLVARIASNLSGVSYKCVENNWCTPEDRRRFFRTCENFPFDRIIIDDSSGITVEQARGKIRRMVRSHGCEIVMLDYLQLMKLPTGRDSTSDKLQNVSNELKSVFRELDVPGIVLAQLNRDSEKEERVPRMSDIRGSGSLEQDADNIFAIFRPQGHKNPGFDLHHLKGRNGGAMFEPISLYYDTDTQRILSVAGGDVVLGDVYAKYTA